MKTLLAVLLLSACTSQNLCFKDDGGASDLGHSDLRKPPPDLEDNPQIQCTTPATCWLHTRIPLTDTYSTCSNGADVYFIQTTSGKNFTCKYIGDNSCLIAFANWCTPGQ